MFSATKDVQQSKAKSLKEKFMQYISPLSAMQNLNVNTSFIDDIRQDIYMKTFVALICRQIAEVFFLIMGYGFWHSGDSSLAK